MIPPTRPAPDRLERWCDRVALIGFAGLVGLTTMVAVDVLARFFLNQPLHGVNDVSAVVIALVVASCFPASLMARRHLTITAVGRLVGPRTAAVLDAFGAFLLLCVLLLIAWQFIDFTRDKYVSGHTTWILRWPTWPWWAMVTALFGASALVQAVLCWRALRRIGNPGRRDAGGSEATAL
jgi:TRAP-type transport system small permease protein